MNLTVLYPLGAALIIVGVAAVIIAIIAASTRGRQRGEGDAKGGKVKAAGIIMIGPIPIIFGTDKKSVKTVLILALALVIAAIIAMVVFWWLMR